MKSRSFSIAVSSGVPVTRSSTIATTMGYRHNSDRAPQAAESRANAAQRGWLHQLFARPSAGKVGSYYGIALASPDLQTFARFARPLAPAVFHQQPHGPLSPGRPEDAGGMRNGDPVQMRGVNIGRVTGFDMVPDGVAVTMEIYNRYFVPEDNLRKRAERDRVFQELTRYLATILGVQMALVGRLGNGGDVIGRGTAAATDNVDQAVFGKATNDGGGLVRLLVVLTEGIRQASVGIARDAAVGSA